MTENSLIHARWVVPVEPAGAVLEDHAVAVTDGRIEARGSPAGVPNVFGAERTRAEAPKVL